MSKENKISVGVKDCLVELYHEPSNASGSGANLNSALLSLGASKEFQQWVSKQVSKRLAKGESADALAQLDPKTMEINVTW